MNLSGKVVKALATNYRLPATNIWVIHDDIDLPLGKIRIVKGRGAAGHKGVQSIIYELSTKDFIRFRIGIRPQELKNRKQEAERFVLQRFSNKERGIVKEIIEKTGQAIEIALKESLEKSMQKYNQ